MSSTAYSKLFKIELGHTYYDTFQNDFDIVPALDTVTVMNDLKLVIKPNNTGLMVMAKSGDDNKPFKSLSGLVLRFFMVLKNKEFLNYTDLHVNMGQEIFYFNNLNIEDNEVGDDLMLHPASIEESYPFSGEVFTVASTVSDVITVKDVIANTVVYTGTATSQTFTVDLRSQKLNGGLYEILRNGTSVSKVYLTNGMPSVNGILGVIEVYEHTGDPDYQFLDSAGHFKANIPVYQITFKARATKWKYLLELRNNTSLISAFNEAIEASETSITGLDISTALPGGFLQTLDNTNSAKKVVEFESVNTILFQQLSRINIKLVYSAETLVANLPNASTSILNKNPDGTGPFKEPYISEIYIQV